jgi:predicted transcriptional regulator
LALLKAPSKQLKTTMLQVRLEEEIRLNLDRYAEFLDANPSYIVSEVLKLLYRKDRQFQAWLSGQYADRRGAISKGESLQLELK